MRKLKAAKKVTKVKSLPKLIADAQKVFNAWIRKRDEDKMCISCGKPGNQAGHYFPTTYSALRFNEQNVNLQCAYCNCYQHGNLIRYRIGLVKRIGEDKVKKLEDYAVKNRAWKWTRIELEEIIKKYK